MKKVFVKVCGKRPLLINAFKIEAITSLTKVKTGSAGNDPEEWKRSVLEINNQLYLPGAYWRACLKGAAAYTKVGRGTLKKSFVSCCDILDERTLLDRFLPKGWQTMSWEEMERDSSKPVYLDIRGTANPNTKGKNVRYRIACCPGWKTQFSLEFDDNVISHSQIKKIIEDSGRIGIADGREIGCGRFDIEECTLEK
jgi:hypothetical protein